MSTIQVSQDSELFGINKDPLFFLDCASKNYPEIQEHLINFKKSIEVFNSIGIEVDISIRGNSVIFQN